MRRTPCKEVTKMERRGNDFRASAEMAARPRPTVAEIEERQAKVWENVDTVLCFIVCFSFVLYCGLNPL